MGLRVALCGNEDTHAGVKFLQSVAKVVLKALVDDSPGRDVPEAGELLLELGGQRRCVNGGKVELGSGGKGEAVVCGVVGGVPVESGRRPGQQESAISIGERKRRDSGAYVGCGGGIAGLEGKDCAQVGVGERRLGVKDDVANVIER